MILPFTANVLKPIHVLIEAKSTVKIDLVTEGLIGDRTSELSTRSFNLGS